MNAPVLAIIPFGSASAHGDRIRLTDKFVTGLRSIVDRWPGSVALVVERRPGERDVNVGARWFEVRELPVDVTITDDVAGAVRQLEPNIISAGLEYARSWLVDVEPPVVYTSEFTSRERLRNTLNLTEGALNKVRVIAGASRQALALHRMVKSAAGIQCNGWPTWEAFRKHNDRCLLFYDTRLGPDAVREPRPRQPGPLTVAFSGRLVELKGPMDAVRAVEIARQQGHDVRLRVYGEGPLADQVAASLGARDEFAGTVDFESEWLAQVHGDVDLMLLPYRQGDPAGTFLEAAGIGVPTLGYDSVALASLVREEGIGWTVPVGDVQALARELGRLASAPHEVEAAGARGAEVMRKHHSEAEFDRRVEHLVQAHRQARRS